MHKYNEKFGRIYDPNARSVVADKSRRRMNRQRTTLIRRVLRQEYALWRLEYFIFTYLPIFHQKSSKLSLK